MFMVCGEALYDVFVDGDNPGSFVLNARAGGSPFNVAIGLARLDQPVGLLTGLSQDMLGERLSNLLEAEGVSNKYLLRTGRPTTMVLISVSAEGQPSYTFYGVGSADCGVEIEDLPGVGKEVTGIHFGSYSLVVRPVADAFATLRDHNSNLFISVDPNIRLTIEPDIALWKERMWQYISAADLIKISAEDIDGLYPGRTFDGFAAEALSLGSQLVVVTNGGNEVCAWTASGLTSSARPGNGRVVDTVGAGDTFQAALLQQLLLGGDPKHRIRNLTQQDLDSILDFATRAAAITCSRRGADLPRLDEIE